MLINLLMHISLLRIKNFQNLFKYLNIYIHGMDNKNNCFAAMKLPNEKEYVCYEMKLNIKIFR